MCMYIYLVYSSAASTSTVTAQQIAIIAHTPSCYQKLN